MRRRRLHPQRLAPLPGRKAVGVLERDAEAVGTGITNGGRNLGNVLCGIAQQFPGLFHARFGEAGLERQADGMGKEIRQIGGVHPQIVGALPQCQRSRVVPLNSIQHRANNPFGARLRLQNRGGLLQRRQGTMKLLPQAGLDNFGDVQRLLKFDDGPSSCKSAKLEVCACETMRRRNRAAPANSTRTRRGTRRAERFRPGCLTAEPSSACK